MSETAKATRATRQPIAAGADAFLQKPLEPRQLVSTVKDLLRRDGLIGGKRGASDE